jgi:8-oxo-dGTP pyrophosphatase MutT (NUDIX family)
LVPRALIEQRLRRPRPPADPRERAFANVIGPVSAEFRAVLSGPMQHAAVLLALVEHAEGLNVLLTERAAHLKHHAGQISFPGGRLEEGETAVDAALREAHEEIGLKRQDVAIAGALDPLVTGTGFSVTPVVAFIAGPFSAQPDPAEVTGVFEVPLEHFLAPGTVHETQRERLGSRFRSFEFHCGNRLIWGATAVILVNFRNILLEDKTNG